MTITAFEVLYKEHYEKLRNLADNIIGRDQSHDVVQDVFLKLWNKRDSLEKVENQKAYMFKAVINASLTQLEKNKRFPGLNVLRSEPAALSSTELEQKELEKVIALALDDLPPKCKAIFVLSRFEEMKYSEIAQHLDISINTVENQMAIALKKLRKELGPYLTREFLALTLTAGISVLIRFMPFILTITLILA
jgi:RNA polymerase sigma-70 factor (ECF subfamily)